MHRSSKVLLASMNEPWYALLRSFSGCKLLYLLSAACLPTRKIAATFFSTVIMIYKNFLLRRLMADGQNHLIRESRSLSSVSYQQGPVDKYWWASASLGSCTASQKRIRSRSLHMHRPRHIYAKKLPPSMPSTLPE